MPISILPPAPAPSYFTTTNATTSNDSDSDDEMLEDDDDVDMDTLISRAATRKSASKPRTKRTGHFHRPSAHHLDEDDLTTSIVTPGELITQDPQWMRGHGTYLSQPPPSSSDGPSAPAIVSTLCGTLHKTNKLLSIIPLSTRYVPAIGDLLVARIVTVQPNRWKCEINAPTLATLLLSSINLPGGILRRRTAADELQMRSFFQEGDLLVAEVQGLFAEGGASLHTRSLRYGKLRGGYFLSVGGGGGGAAAGAVSGGAGAGAAGGGGGGGGGVVRSKSHVWTISTGRGGGEVDVIAGVNGYIWIGKKSSSPTSNTITTDNPQTKEVSINRLEEEASAEMYSSISGYISRETRREIARLVGCVKAMVRWNCRIDEAGLNAVYEAALDEEVEEEGEGMDVDVDMGGGREVEEEVGRVWLEGERGRRVVERGMARLMRK